MSDKVLKYGIMGGTFDPIHIGHLVIAEEIRNKFQLDKVVFVPTGNPPHKDDRYVTDSEYRYQMTLLATISNPYFDVSRVEIERKGTSYTIDTVKELKSKCKDNIEFYFITGADAILELSSWKSVDELLNLCKFVAATRPGFNIKKFEAKVLELEKKYNRSIYTIAVPALQISSTDIRDRLRTGKSVRYLLPEIVEHYIYKNNMYSGDKLNNCF